VKKFEDLKMVTTKSKVVEIRGVKPSTNMGVKLEAQMKMQPHFTDYKKRNAKEMEAHKNKM